MKKEGKDTSKMERPTTPNPGPSATHKVPGNCYSSVISPIAGFSVKGAIFHQGYNNQMGSTCRPKLYRVLMKLMVEGWREDFNDAELPVGVIGFCAGGDIAAWSGESAEAFGRHWVRDGHDAFDRLARLRQPEREGKRLRGL